MTNELDLSMVKIAQENYNTIERNNKATRYINKCAKRNAVHKAHKANRFRKIVKVGLASIAILLCTSALYFVSSARETTDTIIRYGSVYEMHNGNATILTDDGNLWGMDNIDLRKGSRVRVVFESKNSETVEDDVIVNIIEY